MSKAILVVDMPKRCKDCFRYRADAWFGGCCTKVKDENGWNKQIGADDEYNVQNWCPLRPYKKSIPIEWIKDWRKHKWLSNKPIEERMVMAMGVRLMLEDWEKENETDRCRWN